MNKSLLVSSLGLVLLFLVHVARIPTEPVALEDIFASLETPVQPRSPLPSARDFTSPLFTRRGMGRDSLVQKMHRLEAKKKILEVDPYKSTSHSPTLMSLACPCPPSQLRHPMPLVM